MRPSPWLLGALLICLLACSGLPSGAEFEEAEVPGTDPEGEADAERPAREPRRVLGERPVRALPDGRRPGREIRSPGSSDRQEPSPDADGAAPAREGQPASEPSPTTRSRGSSGSAPPGISQLDATSWEVQRAVVEGWMADPSTFADAAPHDRGWQLRRLGGRGGSAVGFKNGDVVVEVNGRAIGTLPQAMLAYAQLKDASELRIRFLRDGRQREHHVRIR